MSMHRWPVSLARLRLSVAYAGVNGKVKAANDAVANWGKSLCRHTSSDARHKMSGNREVVGYGINGSPIYIDCVECPFPAIRYREATPEICALREKERGDWHKLSKEDKKMLYRYSFGQTYAEFQHFTPEWKLALGVSLWMTTLGFLFVFSFFTHLYDPYPESFDEEHRSAQLRRIIQLEMNPVTGLSSEWDYERNKWKSAV